MYFTHLRYSALMMKATGFPQTWMFTKLQGVSTQKTVNFLCSRWSVSEMTLNFCSSLNAFILGYCCSCYREKAGS